MDLAQFCYYLSMTKIFGVVRIKCGIEFLLSWKDLTDWLPLNYK